MQDRGTARRHRLFAVLTMVAGTALGLGLLELALRIAGTESSPRAHFRPGIYSADAELGWALSASYRGVRREDARRTPTRTNALGFRGPELDAARRAAEQRVLVLGDSCTFGLGVGEDETWPARLEVLLRERGLDSSVFNAGVPGYDTYQQARVFGRLAATVRPHVVIVTWLPNDAAIRSDGLRETRVMDGYLVDDAERYRRWRDNIDSRGLHASALYRFARVRIRMMKDRLGGRRRPEIADLGAERLESSMRLLAEIYAGAEALGARTVLVTLPRREQAEGSQPSADLDHVAALWRARGVSVVEGLRVLGSAGSEAWHYYLNDNVHLTPLGYDAIARAVVDLPELGPP